MSDVEKRLCMSITVITADPALIVRAQEAFGRVALGLALDGLFVQQNASHCGDDEEETSG